MGTFSQCGKEVKGLRVAAIYPGIGASLNLTTCFQGFPCKIGLVEFLIFVVLSYQLEQ